MALFKALHKEGQTIIVVTHEEDIAGYADRIVRLRDGRIVSDNPTASDPVHQAYIQRALEDAKRQATTESAAGSAVGGATGSPVGSTAGGAA